MDSCTKELYDVSTDIANLFPLMTMTDRLILRRKLLKLMLRGIEANDVSNGIVYKEIELLSQT